MFEQSLLLEARHGTKARALAVSLTTQTAAAGVLLLIPLVYTDRLVMGQLTLPAVLRLAPAPPSKPPVERPAAKPRRPERPLPFGLFVPRQIPKLNTSPIIDEPAFVDPLAFDVPPIVATLPGSPVAIDIARPPEVKPVSVEPPPEKPMVVGGTVLAAKLIHRVVPVYPVAAKLARVSGTVRLMGLVSKEGKIEELRLLSGNPLLAGAAIDAVKQWIYSPTLLNGKPVEVSAPIDVIFALSQ